MTNKKQNSHPDYQIEKAIIFLVEKINQSGHNPKPVILHSVRVGMKLYNYHAESNTVIAGFLHDLLEDTETTELEIREAFGDRVLQLVRANSYNESIKNKQERDKEMLRGCVCAGKEAVLIKTVDILDNCNYYHLSEKKTRLRLLEKLSLAIELFEPHLENTKIMRKLKKCYKKLSNQL